MKTKHTLHKALLLFCFFSLSAKSLLLGDLATRDADNNGFSFNLLNKLAKNQNSEYVYIASTTDLGAEATDIKNYALSAASATGTKCGGIAPAKATINGVADQVNPLHGAQFSYIGMTDTNIALVIQGDETSLYLVTSSPLANTPSIISTNQVIAANNTPGSFLLLNQLTGTQDSIQGTGPLIFATVNGDAQFGQPNGGVAVFRKTSTGLVQQKAVVGDNTVQAVAVEGTSDFLKINDNLFTLEPQSNLYWCDKLFRIFIGVQGTSAGGDAQNGCLNTAVGYFQDNGTNATLTFYPITQKVAITGETKIIGARGAQKAAYVYKQTVMYTSTGLCYLITVGDADDPANNNKMQKGCYALPLVDESVDPNKATTWLTSTTHATLAKKGSLPTTFYKRNKNDELYVSGRGFQTPAQVSADLYDKTDREVLIGGASISTLNAGIIIDVDVYNDTVFVTLSGGDQKPGVFFSQAIFDENGVIKNWTTWKRCTITFDDIKSSAYMPSQGTIFHLEAGNGNTRGVTASNWSTASKDDLLGGTLTDEAVGLTTLLQEQFTQENGGIFGLFDFPYSFATSFFRQDRPVAMMIATGYKKIGLILTHSGANAADAPVHGDFKTNTLTFPEGAIDPEITAPFTKVAAFISGGALDDLEAITSAALITDIVNDLRYVVVGGTGGVAVLRSTVDNTGFNNTLKKGFEGLGANLAFETIGEFTNVKKLWTAVIGDNQYLFVLTNKELYRIHANQLQQANPTVVTLATIDALNNIGLTSYDFFSDVAVSNKLCLLGTNKGLIRNGNGTNICTAGNIAAADWKIIELEEPYTNVAQILPLNTLSTNYSFATNNIGQVMVLTHSNTLTTSAIHRIAIADISGTAITNTTCTFLTRETIKGGTTPYMLLGSLRNCISTNGAMTLTSSLTQPTERSQLFAIPVNTITMLIRAIENYPFTEITLPLDNTTHTIRGLVYNSCLGSWIAYGDFGIQVYE